jgi:hypothetical protein
MKFRGNLTFAVILVLFAVLAFAKTNTKQIKRDFEYICNAQQEYLREIKGNESDVAGLTAKRAEKISAKIKSIEAKNTMEAAAVAEPARRRRLIEQGALDAGLKNWKCPELESW